MKKNKIRLKPVRINKNDPAIVEDRESFFRGLNQLPEDVQKEVLEKIKHTDIADPQLKEKIQSKKFSLRSLWKLFMFK
jgi:hypothetical protein